MDISYVIHTDSGRSNFCCDDGGRGESWIIQDNYYKSWVKSPNLQEKNSDGSPKWIIYYVGYKFGFGPKLLASSVAQLQKIHVEQIHWRMINQ